MHAIAVPNRPHEEPPPVPERFSGMIEARSTRNRRRWSCARLGLVALAALHVAGCDYFPQDPDDTLATVREKRIVRVGIEEPIPPEARRLLAQVERATGATAQISRSGVEPLLTKLDAGEVDLVIAPFGPETPWAAKAALSPPLRVDGKGEEATEWRAAMRPGENRWIMLVEANARRVSSVPDAS